MRLLKTTALTGIVVLAVAAVLIGGRSWRTALADGDDFAVTNAADGDLRGGGDPVPYVGDGFTYQGYLEKDGQPYNGTCDVGFTGFDSQTRNDRGGGGPPYSESTVDVEDGVFTAVIDYFYVSAELPNWLEVRVRCPAGSGSWTTLSPRVRIQSVPVANSLPYTTFVRGSNAIFDKGYLKTPRIVVSDEAFVGRTEITPDWTEIEGLDDGAASLGVNEQGVGFLRGNGPNGALNFAAAASSTSDNLGWFGVYNASGNSRARFLVNGNGAGTIDLLGPSGGRNVYLGGAGAQAETGYISVNNRDGNRRVAVLVDSSDTADGEGGVFTYGPNGNRNAGLGASSAGDNYGWLGIYDPSGNAQASMYVNASGQGIVYGDIKNFRMDNPAEPGTEIWYASLEGPEAAAYARGTAQLVKGEAFIVLPDHFRSVAVAEGMTVQVTPLSVESLGLAVVEKSLEGIIVRELQGGTGTYEFDFTVTAVRRGYEDYEVVRPALESTGTALDVTALPDDEATTANPDATGEEESDR